MKTISLLVVVQIIFVSFSSCSDILVTLPNGQISGIQLETPNGVTFYGFRGIPYAEPPLGDFRFQAPRAASNWSGILNATKDGKNCIQMNVKMTADEQSEDCLFVNVYTPTINKGGNSKLLPVMFWIFGGGFSHGVSTYKLYGPDYLVEEDVIFVSINYRLGPLGFLSTGDDVIPGNAGLKDINLGLKWIQENIEFFGGDPEKVTIFGESAGAAAVAFLISSNQGTGLFRAAISESGTSLGWWALNPTPRAYTLQLAASIDNTTTNCYWTSVELLDFFKNLTADEITAGAQILHDLPTKTVALPVIEVTENNDGFLTASPYEILSSGNFNKVPLLIGTNAEEYLMLMKGLDQMGFAAKDYDANLENLIPVDLTVKSGVNKTLVGEKIKDIYLNSSQMFSDNIGSAIRGGAALGGVNSPTHFNTDNEQSRSIIKHAMLQSDYTDVFFYRFSYHGLLGRMQNYSYIPGTLGRAGHQEEMPYIFKMIYPEYNVDTTDLSKFPAQDRLVQKRMVKLWTSFAKTMNPTPEPTDLLQNITWPILDPDNFQFVDIGTDLAIVNGDPRGGSSQLWDDIYYSYGVQPFITF